MSRADTKFTGTAINVIPRTLRAASAQLTSNIPDCFLCFGENIKKQSLRN